MSLLTVKKMPTSKNDTQQRTLMEEGIIPKFPCITILSGSAGSGKTSVVYNLLTNPLMYGPSYELMTEEEKKKEDPKGFFDAVFLFLGSADDAYDILIKRKIILPNHVCLYPSLHDLDRVIQNQKNLAFSENNNVTKIPKVLFIIDDLITDAKLMKSKPMLELMTRGRHINSSVLLCTQYINSVPKPIRQQASFLILFKLNRTEVAVITEQYCPPNVSVKDFHKLIEECTKDDEKSHNNFMIISKTAPLDKKFRRNFNEFVIPHDTEETPKLKKDKKIEKAEKKDQEQFEDLLDEPVQHEDFSINTSNNLNPDMPLKGDIVKKKNNKYFPNPNGFINPRAYHIGKKTKR